MWSAPRSWSCCDNRYSDHVYPQQADFTFYGGLYRYVRLISAPASRFTLDDHGGSGVYIDAEPAGDGSAAVTLRARLDGAAPGQTVGVEILDAAGQTVAESWAFAGPEVTLTASIPSVWRWNGTEDPYLYTARLRLLSYNEVVDELRIPFGVRNFSIDRERGFLLNGASHPLRGDKPRHGGRCRDQRPEARRDRTAIPCERCDPCAQPPQRRGAALGGG